MNVFGWQCARSHRRSVGRAVGAKGDPTPLIPDTVEDGEGFSSSFDPACDFVTAGNLEYETTARASSTVDIEGTRIPCADFLS